MTDITIKYDHGQMLIHLDRFLSDGKITKVRKLLKLIRQSYTGDVYSRYQVFCADCGMQPMSNIVFSKQINKRLGFETVVTKVGGKSIRIFRKV